MQNIDEFERAVNKHADLGHCLLKGNLDGSLFNESRAGHTNSDEPTQYAVLDIDGVSITPDELMRALGFENKDYFYQYSSSSGIIRQADQGKIIPPLDRYHIFTLLESLVTPKQLKTQLKHWNLNIPQLRNRVKLTKTNLALSYPLDISVCQNDKLIYITRPICREGVIDTLA